MWPLAAFRCDDAIPGSEIYLFDEQEGEERLIGKALAIDIARSRGANLVASSPAGPQDQPASCFIGKVSVPPRWEQLPVVDMVDRVDESLWFDAACGGRDFLLDGAGHTFTGRMSAWCPETARAYNVSLSEMGTMSAQTRYFIRGFLSGNEPGPPKDDDGDCAPEDLRAWQAATARFRRTGQWYGRWGTCSACGCVLLPDRAATTCQQHTSAED